VDDLDRSIMIKLQEDFPLTANPYEVLAVQLGLSVDALWQRIIDLVESGMIRRIGFSIDSRKIGYSSTLAAIQVPNNRIQEASDVIQMYPQITHSYLRDDGFNIWFTVIAEDSEAISGILEEIRSELGLPIEAMMNLPVKKLFKLDARFK
jgi:DNA-binding Lrp family transcriptional regulator